MPPTPDEPSASQLPPESMTATEATALDRAIAARDAAANLEAVDANLADASKKLAAGLEKILRPTEDISAGIIADKELRRDLDALLQKLKGLPPSRERSLCATKIEEAALWISADEKRLEKLTP